MTKNLSDIVRAELDDSLKIIFSDPKQTVNRKEFWGYVEKLRSTILRNAPNNLQTVVGFWCENNVIFPIAYHGIIKSGHICCPFSGQNSYHSYLNLKQLCSSGLILVQERFIDLIDKDDWQCVESLDVLGNIVHLLKLKCETSKSSMFPDDTASLMYTSGSTGTPKGVVLSHDNLCSTISRNIDFLKLSSSSNELNTLPLSHSFGLGQMNAVLAAGGRTHILPGLKNLKDFFLAPTKMKVTSIPTTPIGVGLLTVQYEKIFFARFQNLEYLMINSAPLSPTDALRLINKLHHCRVCVYYGLTEASRATFCELSLENNNLETVGKPGKGVQVTLDPDTSEIIILGDNVASGLLVNNVFKRNDANLIRTRDKGAFDEYGNLKIIGRLDDELNIDGLKVDPQTVEAICKDIAPEFEFCLSVNKNMNLCLLVETKSCGDLNFSELKRLLAKRLNHYEIPKFVIKTDGIPRIENGKIDRKQAIKMIEKIDNAKT